MTKYRDHQNKKIVFHLIHDMKALHAEMEQELGITLDKDYSCTQPSGKSTFETNSLGCEIIINQPLASYYENALSIFRSKSYLSGEATLSNNRIGFLYRYRKSQNTICAIYSNVGFSYRCTFSARHANKQAILDRLDTY